MNFEEYRVAAFRTMSKGDPSQGPGGANFNLRQAVWGLGLAGEAGEVAGLFLSLDIDQKTLTKELGDVAWYVAAVCTHNGWSLADVADTDSIVDFQQSCWANRGQGTGGGWGLMLCEATGRVADHLKKVVGHGHVLDQAKVVRGLRETLEILAGICFAYDLTLEQVCEANIVKLNARYPAGFSTEASVNRAPGDT